MLSRLRWNKVLRDAWRHKMRSVLVILAIAVGVATFGMLLTAEHAARVDMYQGFWGNVPPNILLYMQPFDRDAVEIVRDMPEVADAQARAMVNARMQVAGDDTWVDVELNVLEDYEDSRVGIVRPESGAWPPGRQEMLLERSTLSIFNVSQGDTVIVEMQDGLQREMVVSGLAHEFNYFSSFIIRMARGFVTLDTLEWLGRPLQYNTLYITVAENAQDPNHLEQVRNQVIDRLEGSGYYVAGYDDFLTRPGRHWADDFFSALMMVLGGVGFLTLFLSGFLVVNTTLALLAQETRQIGMMKAVGAQRGQVMGIYLSTVLLYGGIALLLAVPLSLLAGQWFAEFGAMVMNYDIVSYGVVPWVLGLQVIIALGVPAIAALFPILAGTRMTVQEAVADYGIDTQGVGLIDRLLVQVRGLPRPMALSLRNTFRRRMRLLLTLAALSLAGAIFVGVFSTRASLMGALYDVLNLYDYHVAVYFDEPVRAQRLEMLADQVPGVTRAEAWLSVAVTRVLPDDALGETFTCLGGPVDQQTVSATMLDGRWLLPEDGQALVIANTLAEQLDVVVGDEMQLDINGRESTWQVVGVYLSAVGNQLAYTNDVALSTAAGLVGRADRVRVLIDNADSALVQDDLGQALAEQFEQAGLPVSIYQTLAEIMAANMNQFNMIIYLMLVMAALLAVVGGLGLGATMGLNVLERTREIGVMRAIGATNRITWGIVVVEGVLIGLLSWVIGTLLSYPVGCLLNGAVGSAFLGVLTGYAFSYPGVVVWLVVVVIVSIIASLAPARRASRISVREALTYE